MVILDHRGLTARLLDDLDGATHGLLAAALTPLAGLYAIGVRLDRGLRRRRLLPPEPFSIAVGNLRVGGTGKTPVVADLATRLLGTDPQLRVVSRGYGAAGGGDEPAWLQSELGVATILAPNRKRGVEEARAQGARIVLLDDALQSRDEARLRLAILLDRDLRHPPRLLPAGPGREGSHALRRAHAVLIRVEEDPWPVNPLQRGRYADWARQACGGQAFAFRLHPVAVLGEGGAQALQSLPGLGRLLLVSGLARPASFERDAHSAGARAAASLRFADHAEFSTKQARGILEALREMGARAVLCPEKNHQRLAALDLGVPLFALRSAIEWAGESPAAAILASAGDLGA